MKTLFGNTGGLKANQMRRLENLYRRRVSPELVISQELARDLSRLSFEIRRQIGLLINRLGKVAYVLIGDHQGIVIPETGDYRAAPGRLKGLRLVHTHLKKESLNREDLTDLSLLRLDMIAAITVSAEGEARQVEVAHVLPQNAEEKPYRILPALQLHQLDIDCVGMIQALENELSQAGALIRSAGEERALLVSVTSAPRRTAKDSLAELEELAVSSGIEVVGIEMQLRNKVDPRLLMGPGKLQDLTISALQKGVSLIIFDQELGPSQLRAITDKIDLKVIDRTQLILDIFAQRAQTREGKLQVELAQLKYLLPRLVLKNTGMSRLTGGVGGRGPGETKLEINRRRVRDRITMLEKALGQVTLQRRQQKARRDKRELPVISIIGYTNAGKSTLLNALTRSEVLAESRLFATLDPSSRRLKFPRDIEVIITDTVGFIRDLPKDLMVAFRATLEELTRADLLLHVIDIGNPRYENQIESVEKILSDLDLDRIQTIRVLNKMDRVDPETVLRLRRSLDGVAVSARDAATLPPLIERMAEVIGRIRDKDTEMDEEMPEE